MSSAPIADGALALAADDTIVDVGERRALTARYSTTPEERAQGALLPGLVNAHTHLELSVFAGRVPGGHGLVDWASDLLRARADIAGADARQAASSAAAQATRLGTAAVGDTGNSLDAIPGIAASGLRGMFFHELVGSREARTGDALADADRERRQFLTDGAGPSWPAGLGYTPSPHAPYSADPALLRRIFAAAGRAALPASIHVAEDPDELALLRDGSGHWPAILTAMNVDPASRAPRATPVAYLQALGAFDTSVPPLLVHMVHVDADQRRRARDAGATVVLCPRSNLHIGGVLPDVPALLADGLQLAVGTDSLASAPDLSLWAELAVLHARFPDVPAARWLEAATLGGAHALRLPDAGALAPGKRPGVLDVVLDAGDLSAPLEALVRNPQPTLRWVARA
jgi:cytosine/adenosine deaminase-related metal-dependent hydrolase